MKEAPVWETIRQELQAKPEQRYKLNGDQTVAVATDYYWNDDMSKCPRGVRVQLLGAGGVAQYSHYDGKNPFWTSWAPLPKRKPK